MKINTRADFDSLMNRIRNLVLQYENNVLHNNQYQFYLANGERLTFEVMPQSVPHLLGIRLDYLRSTGLFKETDAYFLLKEFLENSYSVFCRVQEGHLSFTTMFSNHIEEKLDSFEKVIYYFSPNDIDFVCKYDKSKTFQLGLEKDYPCDYFIAKKDNENNLYLLGLVRQGNMYKPMSNILVLSDEQQIAKLKGLLMNQVITYPNSIAVENMVTGFGNNAHLSASAKLEKIKSLRNYARFIKGVSIDVSFDFQYIANGYQMKDNKINIYKMICQQFMQTIAAREVFLLDQLDESIQTQMDSEMI